VRSERAAGRSFRAVAAGRRQQRYRVLDRQTPDGCVGELDSARRARRGSPDRSGSQLGEAAAAEQVAVATLEHVAGRRVQAHAAEQVLGDVRVVLCLAPPGGGGGGGWGAHGVRRVTSRGVGLALFTHVISVKRQFQLMKQPVWLNPSSTYGQ
jgi:hypothetical protein